MFRRERKPPSPPPASVEVPKPVDPNDIWGQFYVVGSVPYVTKKADAAAGDPATEKQNKAINERARDLSEVMNNTVDFDLYSIGINQLKGYVEGAKSNTSLLPPAMREIIHDREFNKVLEEFESGKPMDPLIEKAKRDPQLSRTVLAFSYALNKAVRQNGKVEGKTRPLADFDMSKPSDRASMVLIRLSEITQLELEAQQVKTGQHNDNEVLEIEQTINRWERYIGSDDVPPKFRDRLRRCVIEEREEHKILDKGEVSKRLQEIKTAYSNELAGIDANSDLTTQEKQKQVKKVQRQFQEQVLTFGSSGLLLNRKDNIPSPSTVQEREQAYGNVLKLCRQTGNDQEIAAYLCRLNREAGLTLQGRARTVVLKRLHKYVGRIGAVDNLPALENYLANISAAGVVLERPDFISLHVALRDAAEKSTPKDLAQAWMKARQLGLKDKPVDNEVTTLLSPVQKKLDKLVRGKAVWRDVTQATDFIQHIARLEEIGLSYGDDSAREMVRVLAQTTLEAAAREGDQENFDRLKELNGQLEEVREAPIADEETAPQWPEYAKKPEEPVPPSPIKAERHVYSPEDLKNLALTPEDRRAVSEKIKGLLGAPGHEQEVMDMLGGLGRAGLRLKPAAREKALEYLRGGLAHVPNTHSKPQNWIRYVAYYKGLGGSIDSITSLKDINDLAKQARYIFSSGQMSAEDFSKCALFLKTLGVEYNDESDGMKQKLAKDTYQKCMEFEYVEPNVAEPAKAIPGLLGQARHMLRLGELGIQYGVEDLVNAVMPKLLGRELEAARHDKKWGRFAFIAATLKKFGGSMEGNIEDAAALLGTLDNHRQKGKWQPFIRLFNNLKVAFGVAKPVETKVSTLAAVEEEAKINLEPESLAGVEVEGAFTSEFLEEIEQRGRMAAHSSLTADASAVFADRASGGYRGFQDIADEHLVISNVRRLIRSHFFSGDEQKFLESQGIDAGITIKPIVDQSGRAEIMGSFIGDMVDESPAYRIDYVFQSPAYQDDADRPNSLFMATIILPQDLARQTFKAIENNPSLVRQVLRTLNPTLMDYEEHWRKSGMPKENSFYVVPEGVASSDAFNYGADARPKELKAEYIKEDELEVL